MKKTLSIALALQSIAAVTLFLPWFYLEKYYPKGGSPTQVYNISFMGGGVSGVSFLGYASLAFMVLSIVLLILLLLEKKADMAEIIASAVAFISLCAEVYTRSGRLIKFPSGGPFAFWKYDLSWLSYIVIALQLAATIIAVITIIHNRKSAKAST